MDSRTLEIVEAGWAMFARYGYSKTTMSDIAEEAGVARQTVYNAFSSKEDILCAVVRHAGELSLEEIQCAWRDVSGAEEKIALFQKLGPEAWYEAILAAPDWGALMEGVNTAAAGELAVLEAKWVRVLHTMLKDVSGQNRDDLEELARFLYSTSKNAKYGTTDLAEMRQRLATIRRAALALLTSA